MKIELWIIYAFIAFFGYFFVNFLLKFVSKQNPFMVSLILYGSAALTMLIIVIPKGAQGFSLPIKAIAISAVIGICSVIATVFAIKSIKLAPNPGYSVAIYSANFVLLAIVAIAVFGSEITIKKLAGIVATLIGLILLSI